MNQLMKVSELSPDASFASRREARARQQRGPRAWAERAFNAAMQHNDDNILGLLSGEPVSRLIDLGCDDGARTVAFAEAARATHVYGVETTAARAAIARQRGIHVRESNLDAPLPYEDASFDVVCSNQVIEHLHDTDLFVSETRRILAPGGYTVVSTENLASWHNVAALMCGWQPFSLTNVSGAALSIGNPIGIHRGEAETRGSSWQHHRVFAWKALTELYETHGFTVEAVLGAGMYPLPTSFAGRRPRHAAFLTIKARRNADNEQW